VDKTSLKRDIQKNVPIAAIYFSLTGILRQASNSLIFADGGIAMERTSKIAGILLGFWWLLLIPAVPATAWGAEFSALMMVKDGAKLMPGMIYVHDGKMRQEFVDERGETITIVRPDKKVVWVIIPKERSYMELPLKTRLPGQFIQIPPLAVHKRLMGQEQVNGYKTDKYQVQVPVGRGLETQNFWVCPKLGLPIKMECRRRHFSVEYKNIREGHVPDQLFTLPPGLKKTSIVGFADKVEDKRLVRPASPH
jgi:hypothetical protein